MADEALTLAVMIADGGDALAHLATMRDQDKLFGPMASDATAWRVFGSGRRRTFGSYAIGPRERAGTGLGRSAGPDVAAGLVIDIDATITIAHSEKENAAKTWKNLRVSSAAGLPRPPRCLGREALAGILRPGTARANTAVDHIEILTMALAALPAHARPSPAPMIPRRRR